MNFERGVTFCVFPGCDTGGARAIDAAMVRKISLWETVDPDEPPLTPEEEGAMDRAHKNFMRGEYVTLDELDDFLAAEALVNVGCYI